MGKMSHSLRLFFFNSKQPSELNLTQDLVCRGRRDSDVIWAWAGGRKTQTSAHDLSWLLQGSLQSPLTQRFPSCYGKRRRLIVSCRCWSPPRVEMPLIQCGQGTEHALCILTFSLFCLQCLKESFYVTKTILPPHRGDLRTATAYENTLLENTLEGW